MSVVRPKVAPALVAELVAAAPARIAKRLDQSPRAAEAWSWEAAPGGLTVRTEGDDQVTLRGDPIASLEGASCTCLLAPRCFHLLAVVSVLAIAEAEPAAPVAIGAPPSGSGAARPAEPTPLPEAQRGVASRAFLAASAVLGAGLAQSSVLRLGELMRVVDEARRHALPRLEAAALRVAIDVRAHREREADFRLAAATRDLAELLLVARGLAAPAGGARSEASPWVGVGRRAYGEERALRVVGVACEPVVRTGYAGVVTHFTDGARLFSAAEVLPGDGERARAAYDAQLRFGEISLTHRQASRGALLFARATVSAEGRLGAGKGVIVARIARDEGILSRLFDVDPAEQLARVLAGDQELVFVRGQVVAAGARWRLLLAGGGEVPLEMAIDDARFPFRENLEQLVAASAEVRLVARAILTRTCALVPLAVLPSGSEGSLRGEEVKNLGYERLGRGDFHAKVPGSPASAARSAARVEWSDPVGPLSRRLERMVLGGRRSLPQTAHPSVFHEATRLRAALLPTAAASLESLAVASAGGNEDARMAEAWLTAFVVLRAVDESLGKQRLTGTPPP